MMNRLFIGSVWLLLGWQSAYAELQDPTRPVKYVDNPVAGPVDTNTLALSLTLISPSRKVVVINGLPLQVGDAMGNEQIVAIEPDCVRLTGPSGNITLFLLDKPVKQAANL